MRFISSEKDYKYTIWNMLLTVVIVLPSFGLIFPNLYEIDASGEKARPIESFAWEFPIIDSGGNHYKNWWWRKYQPGSYCQ